MLDANQRSALAVIRSLGRRGLTIVAADTMTKSLGAASRHASYSTVYSNPATSPAAFVHDIVAMVERLSIDTVISATDLTTMLLASQPNLSRIVRLMAPERASYENLTDKALLTELAGKLGILVPTTQIATIRAAATIAAAHEIGFPVVLKPARSRYLKGAEVVSTSVEIVENPDRLSAVLDRSLGWATSLAWFSASSRGMVRVSLLFTIRKTRRMVRPPADSRKTSDRGCKCPE